MDRSDIPLVPGAVGGLLAYALGYLVTYLWQAPSVRETLSTINTIIELVGGETIPVWKAIGWVFYNAHAVELQVPALGAGTATRTLVGNGGAPSLLFAVPPLVLVFVGAALAWVTEAEDLTEGLATGAALVLGYVLLAIVGAFLFRYTIQDAFIGPMTVHSVVLAGTVYPAIFAGLGGAVAGAIR